MPFRECASSYLLALGPKEACSVLCLLGELFPEEGIWLWKNGTSSINTLKIVGVGTLLGVRSMEDIERYGGAARHA